MLVSAQCRQLPGRWCAAAPGHRCPSALLFLGSWIGQRVRGAAAGRAGRPGRAGCRRWSGDERAPGGSGRSRTGRPCGSRCVVDGRLAKWFARHRPGRCGPISRGLHLSCWAPGYGRRLGGCCDGHDPLSGLDLGPRHHRHHVATGIRIGFGCRPPRRDGGNSMSRLTERGVCDRRSDHRVAGRPRASRPRLRNTGRPLRR